MSTFFTICRHVIGFAVATVVFIGGAADLVLTGSLWPVAVYFVSITFIVARSLAYFQDGSSWKRDLVIAVFGTGIAWIVIYSIANQR